MSIEIDVMHPDTGKRLFDVLNPVRYAKNKSALWLKVFCEYCGRSYRLGERVVDFKGIPCCPSKVEEIECNGSMQMLIAVEDDRHLATLKKNCKPPYPF